MYSLQSYIHAHSICILIGSLPLDREIKARYSKKLDKENTQVTLYTITSCSTIHLASNASQASGQKRLNKVAVLTKKHDKLSEQ